MTVRQTTWMVRMAVTVGGAASLPLHAAFEDMQIEQVIAGVSGNTSVQAIQLRMSSANQKTLPPARLVARDAVGLNPVIVRDFTANVANHGAGVRVLVATANLPSFTSPPITPDVILTNPIPSAYLAAGTLTYESDTGIVYWRLSWGGGSYVGPGGGNTLNDADGNFNPPYSGALPSGTAQALQFIFAGTANSINNANDYTLTSAAATLTKNNGSAGTVTPLGACCFGTSCELRSQANCTGAGGAYQGDNVFCTPNPCAITDCNGNGVNDAEDIAAGTSQDCQSNGVPDECEPDGDADGITDDCDLCPNTTPGIGVNAAGCPPPAEGDFDGDGDADLDDYAYFSDCLAGPGILAAPGCFGADLSGDEDIDLLDFAQFQSCSEGSSCTLAPAGDDADDGCSVHLRANGSQTCAVDHRCRLDTNECLPTRFRWNLETNVVTIIRCDCFLTHPRCHIITEGWPHRNIPIAEVDTLCVNHTCPDATPNCKAHLVEVQGGNMVVYECRCE